MQPIGFAALYSNGAALAIGQYRIAGKDQSGAPIERRGFWAGRSASCFLPWHASLDRSYRNEGKLGHQATELAQGPRGPYPHPETWNLEKTAAFDMTCSDCRVFSRLFTFVRLLIQDQSPNSKEGCVKVSGRRSAPFVPLDRRIAAQVGESLIKSDELSQREIRYGRQADGFPHAT